MPRSPGDCHTRRLRRQGEAGGVTIRNAIYAMQVKLGLGTKQEIVVWAVRNGLLDD